MIGRIIWWSVLGALAVVTLFAQLDRSTRFSPMLTRLVPEAFAGFAAEREAQRAVLAQQPDAALAATRKLIARRPLPSEHLTLLAQAQVQTGAQEAAIASLEAATKRGWRDPLAQLAAVQAALVDGQHEAAALRLQALFATGALPDQAQAALAALLETEGGREAFAERLTTQARWPNNLINIAGLTIAPEHLAPTLALARDKGAQLNCYGLENIAKRYRDQGLSREAALVDPGPCG